ncbi:MAG: serine/threonine protein kinase [Planctomycetes bacterium]|nr:serine/threonine protein kinase [Planctomycetota bacterium]
MNRDPRLISRAEALFAEALIAAPREDDPAARAPGAPELDLELGRLAAAHPELADEFASLRRQWELFRSTHEHLVTAASRRAEGSTGASAPFAQPGTRVGRFELVRLLGRGGMGEVWEAEEDELHRRVALKLLPSGGLPSPEDVARFRREAEATSRVRHAGIVAVHSAGEADGRLYIAYELVEGGRSLRTWLDERTRADELPVAHYRETAELFVALADALGAAHEAGIVHRDLKPQNLLLAPDGRAKVADFGLAKLAGELSLSQSGAFLGTWFYASPEQVRGEPLDARSDVFSLGVTLYECLALRRPFDGDTRAQLVAQVLEHEPADPRTFRSRCPRDLALIAAKALEKPRERRYRSMRELADDLRRHLAHQPIAAREPTLGERAVKWVRRHPTASTALCLSTLAFGGLLSLFLRSERLRVDAEAARESVRRTNESLVAANDDLVAARAESDRNALEARMHATEAQAENAVREQVIRFLTEMFEAAGPDVSADDDPPASRLLARATDRLRRDSSLSTPVRAGLLSTLGRVHEKLGRGEEARELSLEAFELCGGPDGALTRDSANARVALAATCLRFGDFDFGLALLEPVVARASSDPELDCEALIDRLAFLARLQLESGRFAECEATLGIAADYAATLSDAEALASLSLVEQRASLYLTTGRLALAEPDLRAAAALHERELGPYNPETVSPLNTLALVYREMERWEESEALFEDCIARAERSLEPDHPDFLVMRANLASVWMRTGRARQAVELLTRARELARARSGERQPLFLWLSNHLGSAYFGPGEFALAEALHRETLAGRERLLGVDHPTTSESRNNLAFALYSQGKLDEALAVQETTLAHTPADSAQRAGRERLLESIRAALAGETKR